MAKKKHFGKALLSSIVAMFLTISMFVGTTFAWFTDSVTSSNNKIIAGTLKIDLELLDKETGTWNSLKENKDPIFNYLNWEPGYTDVKILKIENEGSLALKWKAKFVSENELSELADVIDVYVCPSETALTYPTGRSLDGYTLAGTVAQFVNTIGSTTYGNLEKDAVAYLGIALKMRESADDTYQGKDLGGTFDIQIIATQLAAENDSFGPDYDNGAQYPAVTSPVWQLPTDGAYTEFTIGTMDGDVTGSAALAQDIAEKGVTEFVFKVSDPETIGDVVNFNEVGLFDQDGNEIDLTGNTEPMEVNLFVGEENANKSVKIAHDGDVIATATVDAEGFVTYNATHFCTVTVEILAEAIGEGSVIVGGEIVPEDQVDEIPNETLVSMLVGNNFYTVSAGMSRSWYEYPNVSGKIEADVYVPEDLYAYSMMYKNLDLDENPAGNGSHSDLTLMNDLDFQGKLWEPIGRFYTNLHGEGKKISNLSDSLFGCVYDCQIDSLTLENVTASGSASGVIAKELAGDIYISDVTIAGENSVTYQADSKTNWPEGGIGVGAICGVSLIGCGGRSDVDVSVTGTIEVNYGELLVFTNNTNLDNLGVSTEFGLNVYKSNVNAEVRGVEGGAIVVNGDYVMQIADGVVLNSQGEYCIYEAAGLYWFADEVNEYYNYEHPFEGETVKLMNDIDLENAEWTPIGDYRFSANRFCGTFDGQGHTVSNFKITKKTDKNDSNKSSYGFFGNVEGTVKNLTIDNASVCTYAYVGALVGRLTNGTLINCHVKNSSVETTYWQAGGMVGQLNDSCTIKDCTVTNTTVTGASALGGLVGPITAVNDETEKTLLFENCSVIDSEIVQKGSFGSSYDTLFGSLFADVDVADNLTNINNCKAINTTVKGDPAGKLFSFSSGTKLYLDGYNYVSYGIGVNADGDYGIYHADGMTILNDMMANKDLGSGRKKGAKIKLLADIDMSGKVWNPVDSHADSFFYLTEWDGQNFTISNITINGQAMFKRFAGFGDVTVKNLTFDNATVNNSGINTAILVGHTYQNLLLENVDVKNSTITGGYKVAPLVGTVYNENASTTITATLKNCDVENVTVKAISYDFCTTGMVAFVYDEDNDKIEFENCTVTNVKLYAPNSYTAHAAIYTTGSETLFDEATGVTVTNVTFENI